MLVGDPPKEANNSKILWGPKTKNESGCNKHLMGSWKKSTIRSMPIDLNSTTGIPRLEVLYLGFRQMEKGFRCLKGAYGRST